MDSGGHIEQVVNINTTSTQPPVIHIHSNGASLDFRFPVQKFWVEMSYVPPQGGCNKCPCQRFTLHPLTTSGKAASSFHCDGCKHHSSFHSLENPKEEAIISKWIEFGRTTRNVILKGEHEKLPDRPKQPKLLEPSPGKRNHRWVPPDSFRDLEDQVPSKRAANQKATAGRRSSKRIGTVLDSEKENELKASSKASTTDAASQGSTPSDRRIARDRVAKGDHVQASGTLLLCPTVEGFPPKTEMDLKVRIHIVDHLIRDHSMLVPEAGTMLRDALMGGPCDLRHDEDPCGWAIKYTSFPQGERRESEGISYLIQNEVGEHVERQPCLSNHFA